MKVSHTLKKNILVQHSGISIQRFPITPGHNRAKMCLPMTKKRLTDLIGYCL